MKKTLGKYLQLWDGLWSVPLALCLFICVQFIGSYILGDGIGFYDPSVFQAAIMASAIIVIFNFAAWLGIFMNFRKVHKYYTTFSSNDFNLLPPWQKLSILGSLYCFYLLLAVLLFIKLV